VVELLNDRCEAEMTYAMRLERMANITTKCKLELPDSAISEEIECFKASCASRAR
jgi:hypothetical protein